MMKKKDLRGALLSEKGFCKNLSMKEFYKESVAWKIINDLGLQLTTKFPKDKEYLKKELKVVESEVLDRFMDFLRKNRKHRDIKVLIAGVEMAKIVNEHFKG